MIGFAVIIISRIGVLNKEKAEQEKDFFIGS